MDGYPGNCDSRINCVASKSRVSETTQWVKALATRPDDGSSIWNAHGEGRELSSELGQSVFG